MPGSDPMILKLENIAQSINLLVTDIARDCKVLGGALECQQSGLDCKVLGVSSHDVSSEEDGDHSLTLSRMYKSENDIIKMLLRLQAEDFIKHPRYSLGNEPVMDQKVGVMTPIDQSPPQHKCVDLEDENVMFRDLTPHPIDLRSISPGEIEYTTCDTPDGQTELDQRLQDTADLENYRKLDRQGMVEEDTFLPMSLLNAPFLEKSRGLQPTLLDKLRGSQPEIRGAPPPVIDKVPKRSPDISYPGTYQPQPGTYQPQPDIFLDAGELEITYQPRCVRFADETSNPKQDKDTCTFARRPVKPSRQCEGCEESEKGGGIFGLKRGEFGTPLYKLNEEARGSSGFVSGLCGSDLSLADSYYTALSPPPCPQSRGYASSMPFLDHDEKRADRMDTLGGRSYSPLSECSRTTNASRLSLAKKAIANSHHQHIDNQSAGSSVSSDPDLHEIIQILSTSSNPSLVSSAAGCIQHLAYNHDNMKARIREAGAIPILVQLLTNDSVCTAALGALRNLSFGRQNTENKIAIQDAHGIPLLVQLLKTSDVYEIQELVTGVFWNLSSSEHLKLTILRLAMEALVKNIIIPQSGWSSTRSDHIYNNIEWTTVFRNATGCLRNLSSAGLEGRKAMRSCPGLVDALLYTLRAVQGKNDVDNKAVENAVCILRNLSYRLESEVTAEQKYGQVEDWRNKGLGGGTFRQKGEENVSKRKKQAKKQKGKENASPMPEHTTGVGLLWQPTVVRTYLDLLLECSNPETLEGAVGALQNLTAPSWQPAEAIRETVRKEKGLSVITSLLRMPNDTVVRATAICLRNLALDIKNKDLLGRNAMHDLVKRLPGGDGSDGMTDVTIAAVICALNEVILTSSENCKVLKDTGGVARLVQVARSQDIYPIQCVIMSNEMLVRCWEFKELKRCIKQQGWTLQLYRQMPGMIDKSDGLEYDESKNQFNASYNSGLDRHSRRDIRQQQEEDHIDHSSSHHNMRAATLGRSFDPSLEYHRPERPTDKGQSLPARGYKEQYGVSDSWV